MKRTLYLVSFLITYTLLSCACSQSSSDNGNGNPVNPVTNEVDLWLTKADGSVKLEKQVTALAFTTQYNQYNNLEINPNQLYQTVDGFGYTLTGGSVELINQLSATKKQELLQELFGNGANGIGISYLRISIGASDLSSSVFSYDDMPTGQTDVNLTQFSLAPDAALIQLLQTIRSINPTIKILGSPWSPPTWMKDNNNSMGGSLLPQYYSVYAQYFVKYIQQMQQNNIPIDAITIQNEPLHPGNNPSLYMTAAQQADFIKNHLGPAFQTAGITTKIICYDHNCDKPEYPLEVLNDAAARPFVDGSAFHLYAGDISALGAVHNAYPTKNVYFTEQWTGSTGSFDGDLRWHLRNVIIGSMRNWSKIALEWNLANDPNYNPHTPGGCTQCKGALTLSGSENITRNVAYYIIAHASKFIPAGSQRIGSNQVGNIFNVAFKTTQGKIVVVAVNDGSNSETFNIKYNGKWVTVSLTPGDVATYIF
ncbi:MAG: hypothetical protein RL607_39 [Bacteroidota bacterium]|jgi:glucosylceramidase